MYAVFETGGKQYRARAGDIVQVEKLDGEVGAGLNFSNVLLVAKPGTDDSKIWLGKPYLSGASVQGEIVGQGRGEKILIIKMKRRKQYRRTQGHRQFYTQLLVTAVDTGAGEKASLAADEKKQTLEKFQSHLAPKGPAYSIAKKYLPKVRFNKAEGVVAKAPAKPKAEAKAAAPKKATAVKAPASSSSSPTAAKKKTPAKKSE